MNKQSLLGLLCGCVIGGASIWSASSWLRSDTYKGELNCTTRMVYGQAGVFTVEKPAPECKSKIPVHLLTGYSFALGNSPKDGDPLVCDFVQHNDWYFTWDRRGHGWFNDKTFSFDNCKVGRQA